MLVLQASDEPVCSIAYSPDGTLLAAAGADNVLRLWDLPAGKERLALRDRPPGPCGVAFSPDGRALAYAGGEGRVEVVEVATGFLRTALPHRRPVHWLAWLPGGRRLLSATAEKVYLWNLPAAKCQDTWRGWWGGRMGAACVASDGRSLARALDLRSLTLLNIAERSQSFLSVKREEARIRSLAFAPDGRSLASAAGWTVTLWDTATRRPLAVCRGHRRPVNAVCFAPHGRTLLTGGEDRVVRVWEAGSGQELAALDWQAGKVNALAAAPDGMTAAAACDGGKIVVWDADWD
jgi:WD40 repeat protein